MTNEDAIKELLELTDACCGQELYATKEALRMAIEALKAQDGTDTNVGSNDLISRQTLQKELALYPIDDVTSEDEAGYNRAINDVQKMVLHLPSAQPEKAQLSGENATFDCISRQTAIDAIDDIESEVADGDGFQYAKWREYFCDLPSAQPEIIRCGQCKYAEVADKEDAQDGYTCQFHRGSIWFSGSYCSWAERRTDGNGRN